MAEKVVAIGKQELDVMRKDASARKQEEACGLLIGHSEGNRRFIEEVIPMPNVSRSAISFSIDPEMMYTVLQDAEDKGMTVIGSYHSHPSGDVPSCLDEKYMEHTSYVWMIVSAGGKVRAFTFDGGVKEMKMEEAGD